mmetsp:Transcript_17080/g.29235  ORF Transcript_17080/g.29235 Transcript_17080/m.29235 type:complete len:207 (-) Transcript_17080:1356-1976(-)
MHVLDLLLLHLLLLHLLQRTYALRCLLVSTCTRSVCLACSIEIITIHGRGCGSWGGCLRSAIPSGAIPCGSAVPWGAPCSLCCLSLVASSWVLLLERGSRTSRLGCIRGRLELLLCGCRWGARGERITLLLGAHTCSLARTATVRSRGNLSWSVAKAVLGAIGPRAARRRGRARNLTTKTVSCRARDLGPVVLLCPAVAASRFEGV